MSKVLYISYNDALGNLGHSQIIPYLRGLKKDGHDFTLLSYEREKVTLAQQEYMKNAGIGWKWLRYHQTPSLPATTFDVTVGIFCCIYMILKNKINTIHARSYVSAFIGLIAGKITRTKLIFDMRGFLADEYAEGGSWDKKGFKYKLVKLFERVLLKNSDHIITLTHQAKKILLDEFQIKKEITVIPCCVDNERFGRADSAKAEEIKRGLGLQDKMIMVYSGSLGGWYMTGEMVDFFSEARKHLRELHFLVLTNSSKQIIETELIKKGISKDEYTILKVAPGDMPEYLAVADFSIAFIKPCFSKKASSPIKFGEYLSLGLPIVTNAGIGDSDEMIGSYVGSVVKMFDSGEYKNALDNIKKLLENKKNTIEKCREVVARYLTLETGIHLYKDVYNHLLYKK